MTLGNSGKSRFARGSMGTQPVRPTGWISREELFDCLDRRGVPHPSAHQLERWRGEGILPRVLQQPLDYDGSTIFFPPETCDQIFAIQELFSQKRKFEYVGWELWWRRYSVGEHHWKPRLCRGAKKIEWLIRTLHLQVHQDDQNDSHDTVADRVARAPKKSIILSRIERRLSGGQLASVYGVILDVALGRFVDFASGISDGFRPAPIGNDGGTSEMRSDQEREMLRGLNIDRSEGDTIFGQQLKLVPALGQTLVSITRALRSGLSEALNSTEAEIIAARDDVRNSMRAAVALYNAVSWIYGPRAFGLRFVAWVSRKANIDTKVLFILIWAKLRATSNDLLSSVEIARLADDAELACAQSERIRKLWETDNRFKKILAPKRIRTALMERHSFRKFLKEVERAGNSPRQFDSVE